MAEFHGTVELAAGITPKNGGSFALVGAHDVQVDDNDKRLDWLLSNTINSLACLVNGSVPGDLALLEKGSINTQGGNESYRAACRCRMIEIQKYITDFKITIKSSNTRVMVFLYENGITYGTPIDVTGIGSVATIPRNTEFRFFVDGAHGLATTTMTVDEIMEKVEAMFDIDSFESVNEVLSEIKTTA